MPKVIEMRSNPEAALYIRPTRKARVKCTGCDWFGYRMVGININLNQDRIDLITASDKIRGQVSYPSCPRCNSTVHFVCVTTGIR